MIILLTDWGNNRGEIQPLDAAKTAQAIGVKIYAVGIGSRGTARFPVDDPSYGKVYVNLPVEIDEETLTKIAEMTGGIYYRATDRPSLEERDLQSSADQVPPPKSVSEPQPKLRNPAVRGADRPMTCLASICHQCLPVCR